MSNTPRWLVCLIGFPMMAGSPAPSEETAAGDRLFALKIQPLFAEKCNACHGDEPEEIKGEFDMRTRQSMLQGGETFGKEVLVPGKGAKSFLYRLVTRSEEDFEMPPKESDKLSKEETEWIRQWIDGGAPWPGDAEVAAIQEKFAEGERVVTSPALSEDWQSRRYESEKLWAYRPLQKITLPKSTANPIDSLISQKLQQAKLAPAPSAAPAELVRRLSFDLTGLPPDPDEVRSFEAAHKSDPKSAVEDLADSLMASPHYGEHFARHWLDVSRYADTAGFANDYARPNAWRYRDYVIRAFNNDKPFDQFVREQIAGDEIDPSDPEKLIATGFLRMGPWEQTSMSVFKETRQHWLDDVTNSVGQTFLAHVMRCAKCHDHKFDPVPTRDYYRMMAVFSTTQFAERKAAFLDVESQEGFAESDKWVQEKMALFQKQKNELSQKIKSRKRKETGDAKVGENGLDPGDEASAARIGKNISRHKLELDRTKPYALAVYTGKTIHRGNVYGRTAVPKNPWAKGAFEKDAILSGGNVYSPTDPVSPGGLSAAESLGELPRVPFPSVRGKRRLALANWIVHEKNPLTARVIVNRVWSWHFGRGLAGNPNNFGGTGGLPTHPELLDFLAGWFIKNGWSIKRLNRLIVTSKTLQRSSRHPDPKSLNAADPNHRLYAVFHPRRLSAEELRDAMLAVSGELNRSVGGLPCRPEINPEVALQPRQIMGGTASVYEPDPAPRQRNRRTIYAEKVRGLRDPFLETFNQPGPDDSCEMREVSTVAPQALTMLNAAEHQDRALAFAHRLAGEGRSEAETIQRAFRLALGRDPDQAESASCLQEWEVAIREEEKITPKPAVFPSKILRTARAEKTGELYDFWEHMPAYKHYQPDLQRSEADPRTRGLAHVCLVLFNLNEFVYLD